MFVLVGCIFVGACALDAASGPSSDSTATNSAATGSANTAGNFSSEAAASTELIAQGQRLFNLHCMACHSVDADGRTESGPHLETIFGRQIATHSSWIFPEHVAQFDFVWTEATMRQWLVTPQEMVNNMCLPFRGLRRENDVDALMAYLLDAT